MKYVRLGKSDLKPSVIGIGTAQFGETRWGYNKTFSARDVIEIVKAAYNAGINIFDTSETYGNFGDSERLLGLALREYRRDDYIIVTKAAPWNLRQDDIVKAADRSLRRLGLTYLDLYLIHHPNPLLPLRGTLKAMERLVQSGKIRYLGVSNFNNRMLEKAQGCLSVTTLTVNEIEYNVFSRRNERYTIPYCKEQNIGIIAYSPLAGGALSPRYRNIRDRPRAFNFYARESFQRRAEGTFVVLQRVAMEKGATAAQIALAWLIAHPMCIPIPAALSVSDVREDAGSCDIKLSDEDVKQISLASVDLDRLTCAFDTYVIRPTAWVKELVRYLVRRESLSRRLSFSKST